MFNTSCALPFPNKPNLEEQEKLFLIINKYLCTVYTRIKTALL